MKNEGTLRLVKDFIFIVVGVLAVSFFFSGFLYFMIKIDETKIAQTRYCPSCGIDLIQGR